MRCTRILQGLRHAIVLTAIVGCAQPTTPEVDPLDGQWSWVDATGGIAGTTRTPATVGYTMAVEYRSQSSTPAQFRVFRDGQLFAETTVRRSTASSVSSGTLVYRDPVLGWPEQLFELIAGDTLVLTDGCCDGFTYRFVRERP